MAKVKLFYLVDFGTGINGQNCVLALFFLEFGIRIVIQLKSENKWLKNIMTVWEYEMNFPRIDESQDHLDSSRHGNVILPTLLFYQIEP